MKYSTMLKYTVATITLENYHYVLFKFKTSCIAIYYLILGTSGKIYDGIRK